MRKPLIDKGVLERVPFEPNRGDSRRLYLTMLNAYQDRRAVLHIMELAGLDPRLLHTEQAVRFLWMDVLKLGASSKKLRELVEIALEDQSAAAYATDLRRIVEESESVGRAGPEMVLRGSNERDPEALEGPLEIRVVLDSRDLQWTIYLDPSENVRGLARRFRMAARLNPQGLELLTRIKPTTTVNFYSSPDGERAVSKATPLKRLVELLGSGDIDQPLELYVGIEWKLRFFR